MPDDAIQFPAMTSEDVPAGLALCRLARWNQTERDWELFLRLSPNDCRVAVKGDQVVGTVTTVNYQNLFSQTLFSWIGMVLVDPAQRRLVAYDGAVWADVAEPFARPSPPNTRPVI